MSQALFLPKSQFVAKLKIFLNSRKQFRAAGKRRIPRRPTRRSSPSRTWPSLRPPARQGQSCRGKCVCEKPAWQDHHLDTAEQHKRAANTRFHVLKVFARHHSGLRRDGRLHPDHLFFNAQKFTPSKVKIIATPPQTDLPDLEHNHPPHQGAEKSGRWNGHQRACEGTGARQSSWPTDASMPRALTAAKPSTNWRDSSLQRPPVSRATTTRRHLSARKSSEYLRSLSSRALVQTAPSILAAPGCAVPSETRAHRMVMSTAHWAPKYKGRPVASTSMALSSFADTARSMLRSLALYRTVAPASRHTLARVRLWSKVCPTDCTRLCGDLCCPVEPTFATNLSDLQRQSDSLQNDGSEEEPCLNSKLWLRRASTQHV